MEPREAALASRALTNCRYLRLGRRIGFARELQPRIDHGVRVEGEESSRSFRTSHRAKSRWFGRPLPADADVFSRLAAGLDRLPQHGFHRRIALVERLRHEPRVAIQAERELREIVRPDRESIEVLEKLLGEDRVRGHFAHHDEPQAVLPRFRPFAASSPINLSAFAQRAHERHH